MSERGRSQYQRNLEAASEVDWYRRCPDHGVCRFVCPTATGEEGCVGEERWAGIIALGLNALRLIETAEAYRRGSSGHELMSEYWHL